MSAAERWDDDAFIRLMNDVIEDNADADPPVNLDAERHNPVVTWDEFAGNFQ